MRPSGGEVGVGNYEPHDQVTVVRAVAGALARQVRAAKSGMEARTRADALIDLLAPRPDDRYGEAWEEAIEALIELGPRALPALTKALDEPEALTRAGAAVALGKIGLQQSVQPLAAHLIDSDVGVRAYVASALGEIGGPDVLRVLVEEDERARVRIGEPPDAVNAAVDALIEIGYYEAYAD